MRDQTAVHGMLFRAEMIVPLLNAQENIWPAKAIDESRPFKFQTRRGIKPQPDFTPNLEWYAPTKVNKRTGEMYPGEEVFGFADEERGWVCPHPVGQIVYAKELHWVDRREPKNLVIYESPRQDGLLESRYVTGKSVEPCDAECNIEFLERHEFWKRRPSIHFPAWAARLWFVVKRVRVERVNQISAEDCITEGIQQVGERFWRNYMPLKIEHPTDSGFVSPIDSYRSLFDSINGTGSFERGDFCWVYDLARISKPKDIA